MSDITGMADSLAQLGRVMSDDAESLYRSMVVRRHDDQAPTEGEMATIIVLCGRMHIGMKLFSEYIELAERVIGCRTTEQDAIRIEEIR